MACALDLWIGGGARAGRLPAAAGRPGGEDRLGARPQLASRRALGGSRAGLGAALGGAAADRAARRLALRARARTGDRRPDGAGRADRVRPRLARGRRAVSLAVARLEAAARLLEPRAHGCDRPRNRLRDPTGPDRGGGAHRRTRDRQGPRVLRGDAAARPRTARGRPRGHRHRPHATRARDRDGDLARHARRPAAVAALRQRGADRRRRVRSGVDVGGGCGHRPARARLRRADALPPGDDGRDRASA